MFDVIRARCQQKHRTMAYPDGPPPKLPDRFRGRPLFDVTKCPEGCAACADACPTKAITITDKRKPLVDLGRCLFCTDCQQACPTGAVRYSKDYRLTVRQRSDLVVDSEIVDGRAQELQLAKQLDQKLMKLFGRSLKLRQVSAGALSGGPYIDHPEQHNGADSVVPVDLYIPGCPPHPLTILEGLLRLLGRIEDRKTQGK